MKLDELPDDLKEAITSLKHGSLSIEADVMEALEEAENLKDFMERASGALNNLMQEVMDMMSAFEHRQLTERERDRMIDIYASGPLTYIPDIDDPLFLLDLIKYYESVGPLLSVEAKHDENFYFAKNGTVLKEWYGKEKEATITETSVEMADPNIWKDLSPEEVREFVQWALDNWKPNTEMNKVWHPVIRRTWSQLNESFATAKRQILADVDNVLFIHKEE